MTLHDTIQADAVTVFCNASDFAESVEYIKSSGQVRSIDAVVIREALAQLQESDAVIPLFEVHVANDATSGITAAELNLGGDSLRFAVRVGGKVTSRTIHKLLGHDEGMLILECR